MDTLTTVVFLLDILSIQGDIKRKLHKKQISKLEKLIQLLYKKSNININDDEYLALYNIYKSKLTDEKNQERKQAIKETIERINYLLKNGEDLDIQKQDSTDTIIKTLNQAYEFISSSIKESVKEILSEPLKERDLIELKSDMSENASLEMVRLFLKSGKSKEDFYKSYFISLKRLNRALEFVLNSENKDLETLKEQIIIKEMEREQEIQLIEKVMVNYNRKEKNINLIEFQSLSSQSINRVLAILKERKSIAYIPLNELYREYQNRLRLTPFTFESIRQMRTTINGRTMTDEDHDVIEDFIVENNYPQQRAIYTYVRDAYLNDNLETIKRDNLRRSVLQKFNIEDSTKKYHK